MKIRRLNKKAAMEMSVGTIVTIVLLMTVLILGLVLVRKIFSGSIDVVDMTDRQIKDEVNKLFSKDDKLVVYPDTREVEIPIGDNRGKFGLGIKNLGGTGGGDFSYEVEATSISKECSGGENPVNQIRAETWITLGAKENNIRIAPGETVAKNVKLNIPIGSPLPCSVRYSITVKVGNEVYATSDIDVILVSK